MYYYRYEYFATDSTDDCYSVRGVVYIKQSTDKTAAVIHTELSAERVLVVRRATLTLVPGMFQTFLVFFHFASSFFSVQRPQSPAKDDPTSHHHQHFISTGISFVHFSFSLVNKTTNHHHTTSMQQQPPPANKRRSVVVW